MHGNRSISRMFGVVVGLGVSALAAQAQGTRAVSVDPETGLAAAVVVEDRALAHTAQLLPVDASGAIAGDTLDAQLDQLIANLSSILGEVGSGLDAIARLNMYVASDALVGEAAARLKGRLGDGAHPAVTWVVSALADPAALVAAAAVAAVADDRAPDAVLRHTSGTLPARNGAAHVAVLPKGRALYISGMAEMDTQDLVVASKGTMDQLHEVLALNGLSAEHVVHLKAFMKPASASRRPKRRWRPLSGRHRARHGLRGLAERHPHGDRADRVDPGARKARTRSSTAGRPRWRGRRSTAATRS